MSLSKGALVPRRYCARYNHIGGYLRHTIGSDIWDFPFLVLPVRLPGGKPALLPFLVSSLHRYTLFSVDSAKLAGMQNYIAGSVVQWPTLGIPIGYKHSFSSYYSGMWLPFEAVVCENIPSHAPPIMGQMLRQELGGIGFHDNRRGFLYGGDMKLWDSTKCLVTW